MNELIKALMAANGKLEFHARDYGHQMVVENPETRRGCFLKYNDQRAQISDVPAILAYLDLPLADGERNPRECLVQFLKADGL